MSFKPHNDPSHLYFITATLMGWIPLFTQFTYASIVSGALDWHRINKRWELFAYVIMPTHIHAIVKPGADYTISAVLQSFGSFSAHAIVSQLKAEHDVHTLKVLSSRLNKDDGKQHQVWQPIQAKNVISADFLREKLELIHNNPIAKKWSLAQSRDDYTYSSACFYDRGATPMIGIDDVNAWLI